MKIRKSMLLVLAILTFIPLALASCGDNDDSDIKGKSNDLSQKLYVCGIAEGKRAAGTTPEEVLFTEENIEWFNVKTREIKFKTEPFDDPYHAMLQRFNNIVFHIGDYLLFDHIKVTNLLDSRGYTDLVLCHGSLEDWTGNGDLIWGYYLYDCYPLEYVYYDSTKDFVAANREKRAGQWEIFISYLKSKGKLKEDVSD